VCDRANDRDGYISTIVVVTIKNTFLYFIFVYLGRNPYQTTYNKDYPQKDSEVLAIRLAISFTNTSIIFKFI